MFCPDCGAEYRPEFTCCAECGARLVVTLPSPVDALPAEERPDPDSKTVAVFRTSDAMLLPIVNSLLESAGIDYFVQGEEALGLMPVGAMGSGVARAAVGAIIHVFERDAAVVRELLTEVGEIKETPGAVGEY
jgi:hypothetical protein